MYSVPKGSLRDLLEEFHVISPHFLELIITIDEIVAALRNNNRTLTQDYLNRIRNIFPKVLKAAKSSHGIELVCLFGIKLAEILIKQGWNSKMTKYAVSILRQLESLHPSLFQLVKIYELYQILFYFGGNVEQLFFYNKLSIRIYEKLKLKNQIAGAYSQISVYNSRFLDEPDEAAKNAKLSLKIANETGDQNTINYAEYAEGLNKIFTGDPNTGIIILNNQVDTDLHFHEQQIQFNAMGEVIRLKFNGVALVKMGEVAEAEKSLQAALRKATVNEYNHQVDRIKYILQNIDDFSRIRNYMKENG